MNKNLDFTACIKQDTCPVKDIPLYAFEPKEWEKARKIQRIKYEVGDECIFEITKGNKKWTISLDDFFDKVIQICGEKKDD